MRLAMVYDLNFDKKQLIWTAETCLEFIEKLFNGKELVSVDNLKSWVRNFL